MRLLQLSKRHRWPRATCDVCNNGRARHTAPFVTSDPERHRIDICVGCLREAIRIATEGKKASK